MATYTRFSSDDIVITTEKVFSSTWTGNTNAIAGGFPIDGTVAGSPSASTAFRVEYAHVNGGTDVNFAVSYGHFQGSGSAPYNSSDPGYSSTRSVYSQYRSLIYGDETRNFTFNGYEPQDIYVVNVARSRYKQALRPGSLNIKLGATSLVYTDDSVSRSGSAVLTNIGRQFNIVSGSNGVMSGSNLSQTTSGSIGLFYPDAGIMIFNPDALGANNSITHATLNTNRNTNNMTALDTIQGLFETALDTGESFVLDTEEKISSQFYFIRARNKEFNYTTNPSFIDANGNVNKTSMVDNPTTYITTVGLYNDANELLAVAKLSQPVVKDFTKEALIKVKLDY